MSKLRIDIGPPLERDTPPRVLDQARVDLEQKQLGLATPFLLLFCVRDPPQSPDDLSLGIDNQAVPVADSLRVVASALGRRDDVALVLDCPGPQQDLPMSHRSGWDGEGARVHEYGGAHPTKGEGRLGKAKVETDLGAQVAHGGLERRDNG